MPPCGFIRSDVVDAVSVRGMRLLGSIPASVRPFVVDVCLRVRDASEETVRPDQDVGRHMPDRIRRVCEERGETDSRVHLFVLINDHLFYLWGNHQEGERRLTTTPISQWGGDIYLLRCAFTEDGGYSRVDGAWRAWGDATGGPVGQKKLVTDSETKSSTVEGYEVGWTEPDLVLSDAELERVHLLMFPIPVG